MKNYGNKNIEIKECVIVGTRRPKVVIQGKWLNTKGKLILKVDNKEVNYHNIISSNSSYFHITSTLPDKAHKIELYSNIDEKIELVIKKNTNLVKRVTILVLKNIAKIFILLFRIIKNLLLGIKYFWKEYHFLVPVSEWGKFFSDFKSSLSASNKHYRPDNISDYQKWIKKVENKPIYKELSYNPLITILMILDNPKIEYITKSLYSINNQYYKNYELLIIKNRSCNEEVIEFIKEASNKDNKIHLVDDDNYIKDIKGDFVTLMYSKDTISDNALYEFVLALNDNKSIDLIYSDEDTLDRNNLRYFPFFKPDYSPDTILSTNYMGHMALYRTKIYKKINGFRKEYEEATDYDFVLRYLDNINKDKIYHISKVLYHVKKAKHDKEHFIEMEMNVLKDYLNRNKIEGIVHNHKGKRYYWIEYVIPKNKPLVSIIIPTKDLADTTNKCLKSIYDKSTYDNYEIIIANNNSEKQETFELFDRYKKEHDNFKVIDINTEFNYSYINNIAVKHSKGDYIILLNNDTVVITPNWIELMLGYAMQDHVGSVGAKLLYPDERIQHAGVITGLFGVASHAFINWNRNDSGINGRLLVPYNYAANTAACLMVSKKKYYKVKGLNEDLKVCYNDIDFNLKLLDKNYYNVLLPMVELFHFESKSRGLDEQDENKFNRFLEESEYMNNKWKKYIDNDHFYNSNYSRTGSFLLDRNK